MERKNEYVREPAKRIFAAEFRETRISQKFDASDEKAPVFVITPTGECANRLLIVGVLTFKEKKGDPNIYYKGTVDDMTGTFFVMANNYNPEAMSQMASIKNIPTFVAVIGKPIIYNTPDGKKFASVRVEEIREVDRTTRDMWLLDTAKATLRRIEAMEKETDPQLIEIKDAYKTNTTVYKGIVKKAIDAIDESKYT